MPGTLRDIKELEAALDAAGLRGVTKQDLLDLLTSQAKVGGCLSFNEASAAQVTSAGWNRIDGWERSIDTQGVKDGLDDVTDPGGWYKINNAAAGDYTISSALRFTVDTAGDYEIRIATASDAAVPDVWESSNTPYHDKITLGVGEQGHLAIAGAVVKDIARGERVQLEYKAPNGSEITPIFGQFGIQR